MVDQLTMFSWDIEIVHCEDCRFCGPERLDAEGKPYNTCSHPEGMMGAYPGGFCSWGERTHDN